MSDYQEQPSSRPTGGFNLERVVNRDRFAFAVIPDRSGNIRPGVFRRIAQQVDLMSPSFAVFIGDAIEITDSADDADLLEQVNEQWNEFEDELSGLSRPVYMCPGWHDYKSEVHAQIYRQRIGAARFSWNHQGCHFVVLNCYEAALRGEVTGNGVWKLGTQQLDWLALDLSISSSAQHTFIFLHAFYETLERQEIVDLLKNRSFTIISGSSHCYRKHSFNGVPYYQLGTAGGYSTLDGVGNGTVDHFSWVTVDGSDVKLSNVLIDSVLADDFCTEESAAEYVSGEVIVSGRTSFWDE
jgi:hypothetical protein